jgi:hypothetical protein
MSVGVGDQLFAGARVDRHSDHVPHRAARQEEGSLLAKPLSGHLLELVDHRVVTEDVIAQGRRRHRLAHLGRGHRHRIGAKVDRGHALNLAWLAS